MQANKVKALSAHLEGMKTHMKPKEVKDKIIEILFAWYDSQQNAVMNEPTELDAVIMNGGESY